MAYLIQHYENSWVGYCGSLPWLLRYLDLTLLYLFLWGLIKEMTYRTEVHAGEEDLYWIMDAAAAAYI
jgi:hypothetical protein